MKESIKLKLKENLTLEEGVKLFPYKCTRGKLTIGIGRNIEEVGITREEAGYLLENDIKKLERVPYKYINNFDKLSEDRQTVIYEMLFQLGEPKFAGFREMIKAINAGDFYKASCEMQDSVWAAQTPDRVRRLATRMAVG